MAYSKEQIESVFKAKNPFMGQSELMTELKNISEKGIYLKNK